MVRLAFILEELQNKITEGRENYVTQATLLQNQIKRLETAHRRRLTDLKEDLRLSLSRVERNEVLIKRMENLLAQERIMWGAANGEDVQLPQYVSQGPAG